MRTRIKDITSITIGYQHRGQITQLSAGTHQMIQVKDVDRDERFLDQFSVPAEHRLWLGSLYRVTPKTNAPQYAIEEGDVIFLSRGSRYFAIPMIRPYVEPYPSSWEGIIAAYYFYILRVQHDNVLPAYLAWVLNEKRAQAAMETISQGSHMKMIAKSDFGHLAIDVPPVETQRKIVELHLLSLREQRLLEQISQKRTQLVDAACMQAATSNTNN